MMLVPVALVQSSSEVFQVWPIRERRMLKALLVLIKIFKKMNCLQLKDSVKTKYSAIHSFEAIIDRYVTSSQKFSIWLMCRVRLQ